MFSRVLSQITSKRTGWGSHKYSVVSGIEALAQSALLCPVEICLNWTVQDNARGVGLAPYTWKDLATATTYEGLFRIGAALVHESA